VAVLTASLLTAVATASQTIDRPSLLEMPLPDTGRLEEGAQQQMQQARDSLDEVLASPTATVEQLAESYGLLGQLYYVYEFEDLSELSFRNARTLQPDNYRWRYYLAVLARLAGRWQDAEEVLETVLAMQPGDLATLIRLGEAQLELGKLDEAEQSYQQVVVAAPYLAAGYAGRGRVAYARGEYERAIEDLDRALELQPAATSLHHRLGMAYRQAGRLDEARDHLSKNTGVYLEFPDPLIQEAGSLLQSTQVYFNTGIIEVRQGNFDEAVRLFQLALEEQPDDALAAYNLGLALLKKGARQEGIEWLARSVEMDPDFRNGHFNLAMMLAEDGQWPQVVEHLRQAHRIDPEDRIAHLELATALTRVGRAQEAIAELRALLELHPRDPEALLNLGILLAGSGREMEAIEALQRLIEVGGDPQVRGAAHGELGRLLEARGAGAAALAEYQAAVELAPESVETQAALASALGRTGRFAEAAEHYAAVVRLAPKRVDGHFGRAMALMLAGLDTEASAALEKALEIHPQNVAVAHALARLLATSPDAGVRDGDRALGMAEAVFNADRTLEHGETLAMALAEVGRFEEAQELQAQVVGEAERRGDAQVAARARQRLAGYQRGEACRAPWKEGG
jgi:tetratricopeptide (TPR) repeat protein